MLTSSVLTNLALLCSTVLGVHLAIPKNFADPTTINVNGKWYAFASGSNGARIPGATSPDFNNWSVTLNGANDYDYLDAIPAWCYQPSAAVAAPDINQLVGLSFLRAKTLLLCMIITSILSLIIATLFISMPHRPLLPRIGVALGLRLLLLHRGLSRH